MAIHTEKGLLLISDGIDSPVACHLLKQRGFEIDLIHLSIGDRDADSKVDRLRDAIDPKMKLFRISFRESQEAFRKSCNSRYQCILCKRMMHRIAERVAKRRGYSFLANGENLGQVASQTLLNMHVIHQGIDIPIIQPLLIMDKVETISIARDIGTYEISISGKVSCPYVPKNPATQSSLERIRDEEDRIDINRLSNAKEEEL